MTITRNNLNTEEPVLVTDPKLMDIQRQLIELEPIFHHPELGTQRSDYERMTDKDFWEVGASGRVYSREFIISTLLERYDGRSVNDVWECRDFYCKEIAPDNYLLTYTLLQDKTRLTRRSTLWRRSTEGWKILYHQGTVV